MNSTAVAINKSIRGRKTISLLLKLACMVVVSWCPLQHYLMDKDPAHVDLLDLVEKMLEYIPEQRVPLHEALRHPFFTPCKREMRAMALMSSFDDVDTTTNRTPSAPPPVHEEPANTNTKPSSPPPSEPASSAKPEEKVGVGLDSSKGLVKRNKGEGDSNKKEEKAAGSKLIAGVADAPKRWAALPSTNYAADNQLENNLPTSPATEGTKLEDTNIMKHLERQAAVAEADKAEAPEDDSAAGAGGAKGRGKVPVRRTESKGEAPVKARRRRRESKQLREKTPPLGSLELAQTRSLDSAQSEGDEGSESVRNQQPAAPSAKMDSAPSKLALKRPEAVLDLVVPQPQTTGQKPADVSAKLPLLFGTTSIDVTPASPLNQDPPEIMESLGMGHFFNQGTQTPERFYREMCPSPHEFSSIPLQTQDKSTQTPAQFYPPIPTQNVGIDAGQFPEGSSSAHSLDSSLTEVEEPSLKVEEPQLEKAEVLEEEPVTVSVMPLPQVQTAGIFLTQGLEEEEGSVAVPALNQWQSVCSVELPESPVCVLTLPQPQAPPTPHTTHAPPPAAHTTQPVTVTPPQPLTAKTKPSQQPPPPVILQQPQPAASSSTAENAFEAWIETQNAYEEMPGTSVLANPAEPAATVQNAPPPPPVAVVGPASPPVRDGAEQQKARAKRRRERRRRPAPVSESSTDSTATPPSTPTLNAQSAAAGEERLQAAEQGKKKAPLPNVSACERVAQTKGGNPQAGQSRGDKQAGTVAERQNGVHSGGRSQMGEKKRQEFIRSGQASDADEFVLAAESLEHNVR